MPYKIGGGNHLQFYDESNGQYDDQTKAKMLDEDKINLYMVYLFGEDDIFKDKVFHYPLQGVHDHEYNELFVKYYRRYVKEFTIDENKLRYLFKYDSKKDKSQFLYHQLGYSPRDCITALELDLKYNTEIQSMRYSRYNDKCLTVEAKTTIRGCIVTTIWELTKELKLRLITLIPGGDKKWQK